MASAREEGPKSNRGPAAGPENRRVLIAAAREVYAESGLSAPFSAVARRAGVGQGSLYRHFPTPVALAAAVFEENLGALEELAAAPQASLDDLFDGVVAQALVSAPFLTLVEEHRGDPVVQHLEARTAALVAGLLARDQAAGRVGAHVESEDVVMAVRMLADELARTDDASRVRVAERARALFARAFAA